MNADTPEAIAPDAWTSEPAVSASGWGAAAQAQSLLPQGQELVTIDNWQQWPTLRHSFQHMSEIMPSHVIEASDHALPLERAETTFSIADLRIDRYDGRSVEEVIEATETDGFLVLHHGKVVEERYPDAMASDTTHLVMSMSKSIVSCVAATLIRDGVLEANAPLERYVPEVESSGYAGARVRDLLDMRSGLRFAETYLDPDSEVRVMERSMGWAPRESDDPVGMYPFILTCAQDRPHGGDFEYRSIETDMLGWVCERATGARMADLITARVWQPIGAEHDAEVCVDPLGSAIHDGGISATLRDLARLGQMLLQGGTVGERSVAPSWWIEDTLQPPPDVRAAFAASANEPYLPGGWYRNQFWCIPGDQGPIMMCLGIHGQMIFVEPSTHTVGVKLSTWPLPQDADKLMQTIEAFRTIARALSSAA